MQSLVEIPKPSGYKIESLFRNNNFIVPIYQRNYAWQEDEVKDFWNDLQDVIVGKRNSHFFGQIVTFKNEADEQEIIDGQQRLTTSVIFMAVIRDIALELGRQIQSKPLDINDDDDIGDDLRLIRSQVKKSIRGDHDNGPTLVVQTHVEDPGSDETLEEFFEKLTHSRIPTTKPTSEPKENMLNAYNDMKKWITTSLKAYATIGERIDQLNTIFNAFFDHFYIVMISTQSRRDAFTIFETLNSRGKDLKASDIIKNHVMSLLHDDLTAANDLWNQITRPLSNNSNRITRFIRTYWAARYRIVPEARLYRAISDKVNTAPEAQQFLTELANLVEPYTVLESPAAPKAHWYYFKDERLTQQLDILNRLNVKLYYPIILALHHRKFSPQDTLLIVRKIIAVFIRFRTIMNRGTNKLENGFSDIAHHIWTVELSNANEIIDEMSEKLLPSDEQAKSSFMMMQKEGGQRGAKKWTLVYLLAELYDATYDDFADDSLYQRAFNDDNYRLVQISDDAALADAATYLGNWTLLEKNLAKSNYASTQQLISALEKSNLTANHHIASQLQANPWNVTSIQQRLDTLSNNVTLIW